MGTRSFAGFDLVLAGVRLGSRLGSFTRDISFPHWLVGLLASGAFCERAAGNSSPMSGIRVFVYLPLEAWWRHKPSSSQVARMIIIWEKRGALAIALPTYSQELTPGKVAWNVGKGGISGHMVVWNKDAPRRLFRGLLICWPGFSERLRRVIRATHVYILRDPAGPWGARSGNSGLPASSNKGQTSVVEVILQRG
jgi:hypothetical protein